MDELNGVDNGSGRVRVRGTLTEGTAAPYKPYDRDFRANPYPGYREIQSSGCALRHYRLTAAEQGAAAENPLAAKSTVEIFEIFSHEGVCAMAGDHETFSSAHGSGPEWATTPESGGMLNNADRPRHTRQRRIMMETLAPAKLRPLEPRIREIATELIDKFAHDGEGDLVALFTRHFPGLVFGELLGVDHHDQAMFERWASDTIAAFGGDLEDSRRGALAFAEMSKYFMAIVTKRRRMRAAGTVLPGDLLTSVMTEECDGRPFDDEELRYLFPILVVGGNETTASFLSTAVYQFCRHPEQLRLLYDRPERIPHACEEILRFDGVTQVQFRTTTSDVEIDGIVIPVDAKVGLRFGAANHDESVFSEPQFLDFNRPVEELRKHVGFGRGIHSCVGAALARILMRVGIESLLGRLKDLTLDESLPVRRHDTMMVRSLSSVPAKWKV